LEEALPRSQVAGHVLINIFLVFTLPFSDVLIPPACLVALGALTVFVGVFAMLGRLPAAACFFLHFASLAVYLAAAAVPTDPLFIMLSSLALWSGMLPLILCPGAWAILASMGVAFAMTVEVYAVHGSWGIGYSRTFAVQGFFITLLAALLFRKMRAITHVADEQEELALNEEARVAEALAFHATTAEYLRIMHDTVVNTFGALTRLRGVGDEAIRDRCRRDLERLGAFQARTGAGAAHVLKELDAVGLPVRWSGLTGDGLHRYESLLPVGVLRALADCAAEGIRNATKHSGASEVFCTVSVIGQLFRLEVEDRGRGFLRHAVNERGIAGSIMGRAKAVGIEAKLGSEPGRGTRLVLEYNMGREYESDPVDDTLSGVTATERIAYWWACLTLGSGITAIGYNFLAYRVAPVSVLFGVVLISLLTASTFAVRRFVAIDPRWLETALLISIPLANILVLLGAERSPDDALFPSLMLTSLPALLYVLRGSVGTFVLAAILQSMITACLAVILSATHARVQIHSLVAWEIPALVMLGALFAFFGRFEKVGVQLAALQRRAAISHREAVAQETDIAVREQWSASALQDSLSLLSDLADGTLRIDDDGVRERCAQEESALRVITSIPPHASLMSRWFLLALVEARTRKLRLELRVDGARVSMPKVAEAFGELLLQHLTLLPPGAKVEVNMLEHRHAPHLFVVTDSGSGRLFMPPGQAGGYGARACGGLEVVTRELAGQTMVEATWVGALT